MGKEAGPMASLWLLAAMAFITYVLLAGMALGIQKRSVLPPAPPHLPPSLGTVHPPQGGCFPTHTPHGHRFSPEVLGLCASTALVWIVMEVLALLLGIYLATVRSDLSTFHLLAYSGYKYVG